MTNTRAGEILNKHGFWYKEHHERGDEKGFVCKTVLFRRKDGAHIAAMVPLQSRVSYRKLREHYKQDCAPLSPDELRALGFEPGEVAPMLVDCELVVDPGCAQEIIYTGSGTLGWGIEWRFEDLERIRKYTCLDVCS
jgi:prolyl-tRNA editing enzyme YbaK/EbsC (Cys-tRNA(Pro) deacylase)